MSGQVGIHDYLDPSEETAYAPALGADVEIGGWRDGLHVQAAVAAGDSVRAVKQLLAARPRLVHHSLYI